MKTLTVLESTIHVYLIHRYFFAGKICKSKRKSYTHFFFSKNISIYAIFNDQSFNDTLTNGIVGFDQLGPGCYIQVR